MVAPSLMSGLVQGVTIRSQVFPPYRYDPNAPAAPPSPASAWLMNLVKPAVDVETAGGPITIAPWGEPTEDYTPAVAIGGVLTLVGLVAAIGWAARRLP